MTMMMTNPNAEPSDLLPLIPYLWNRFPWYERFLVFTLRSVSSPPSSAYPPIHYS